MKTQLYRHTQALLTFLTLMVLLASFYFEYFANLQPCPLCLMQRFCVFALLLVGIMGLNLSTAKRAHLVSGMQIFFSLAGLFFALRQLWLQSLPPGQAPACMPGLDVLIQYFPWHEVARALLWGSGDCAEVSWTFLGITMPGWTAMYFLFMLGVAIYLLLKTRMYSLKS